MTGETLNRWLAGAQEDCAHRSVRIIAVRRADGSSLWTAEARVDNAVYAHGGGTTVDEAQAWLAHRLGGEQPSVDGA